jgi:hypothetical protein
VLVRNPRLLIGMVHANRPWQLTARLYRALVAAMAVAVYGLVSTQVWRIATSAGALRLALVAAASTGLTVASVILVHGLWERAPNPGSSEQVILFNLATTLTVLCGIATLYCALFLFAALGAFTLITPQLLAHTLGRPSHLTAYIELALLVASLATLGGALGGALESDAAVREAAYARRPRPQAHGPRPAAPGS